MRIIGNKILVSKIEEEVKEGFSTVDVQDNFIFKGKVEQISEEIKDIVGEIKFDVGDTVMFRKYSPDTEDIEHEGKKMKVVELSDVIAIL